MHPEFKIVKKSKINAHKLEFIEFEHKKTGARVVWLKNKDKHLACELDFRIRLKSNKGEAHILEHSVLMSSDKFKSGSDLFSELVSKKVSTYMNAYTMPDKNGYEFSTVNKKDFLDILEVYLDGLFKPSILKERQIFEQEGWRIEKNKEGKYIYSGTVLNEMKGRMSNPSSRSFRYLLKHAFPNSQYAYDWGGDPNEIVDLSYKELLLFYKKFYNAFNSITYFYGNIDIEKSLDLLDRYFSANKKGKIYHPKVKAQNEKTESKIYIQGDKNKDSQLLFAFYAEDSHKIKDNLILNIIWNSLFDGESAPIKKAIKDSGKAQNVYSFFEDDIERRLLVLQLDKIASKDFAFLKRLIFSEINHIKKSGLDKTRIEATLDSFELVTEKAPYGSNRGLAYFASFSKFWSPNLDLEQVLKINELIEEIKIDFAKDPKIFDKYFAKYIADAKNPVILKVFAKGGFEYFKELYKKEKALNSASKIQNEKIEKNISEYDEWQKHRSDLPESAIKPSNPKSFPKILPKDGVFKKIERCAHIYHFQIPSRKLIRQNMYFDSSHLNFQELQKLQLLLFSFNTLSARKMSREDLDLLIKRYTGLFDFTLDIFPKNKNEFKPYISLTLDYLVFNKDKVLSLINSYLSDLIIDGSLIKARAKEFLAIHKHAIKGIGAREYARRRALAGFAPAFTAEELVSGISFIQFLEQEVKKSPAHLKREYASLYEKIFTNKKLLLANHSKEADFSIVHDLELKDIKTNPAKYKNLFNKESIAFVIKDLDANFNVLAFESKFDPVQFALSNDLSMGYLWQKLRLEGGAYGASYTPSSIKGFHSFSSWNDPNIKRSFDVYLESLNPENIQKNSINGAISNAILNYFDSPQSPLNVANTALILKQKGMNHDKINKMRKRLMDARLENVLDAILRLRRSVQKEHVKTSIVKKLNNESEKLFDKVYELDV